MNPLEGAIIAMIKDTTNPPFTRTKDIYAYLEANSKSLEPRVVDRYMWTSPFDLVRLIRRMKRKGSIIWDGTRLVTPEQTNLSSKRRYPPVFMSAKPAASAWKKKDKKEKELPCTTCYGTFPPKGMAIYIRPKDPSEEYECECNDSKACHECGNERVHINPKAEDYGLIEAASFDTDDIRNYGSIPIQACVVCALKDQPETYTCDSCEEEIPSTLLGYSQTTSEGGETQTYRHPLARENEWYLDILSGTYCLTCTERLLG